LTIKNGSLYYSVANNKIVRVIRAHQNEQIAYIKSHAINLLESEVSFSDLRPVNNDMVKQYLKG
jgi:ABC-type enterochelin transport system substrate-binding protein|tara:strand:+ start:2326 stop:2517 length:192 start_codon:yes stop_codon:yes gene_type:complete